MADFATEGGHWYKADGSPLYTIVGKNGKERATTVRDARELGLVPSVTGIIGCAAKPGLERWKLKQIALACLTLPRLDGESTDAFLERAEADSRKEAEAARDRGTAIHAAIEQHYRGEPPTEDLFPWAIAVRDLLRQECGEQEWHPERSFACKLGYGGKIDLHSDDWVIDFKGKDSLDDLKLWDEHYMQLAAYRRGLKNCENCAIVFFNRKSPEAVLVRASEENLSRAGLMFHGLLQFWQAKNSHAPR